mmetsp:Transcript_128/g.228  ORF Transcript_128/g.228 Transcript_128/m.228 type:complete len:305 (+) Transcript_128:77-991(+)
MFLRPQPLEQAGGGDVQAHVGGDGGDGAGGHDGLAGDDGRLGEDAGALGVGEVVGEARERPLAGHLRGHGEADERKHREPSVLDLLHLQLVHVAGDEGSEDAAGVADLVGGQLVVGEQGVDVHRAGLGEVVVAADLDEVHQHQLDEEQCLRGDVGLGLHGRLVPEDVGTDQLLNQDAGDGKHSPARMDALGLGEPLELIGVRAQTQGVESKIAGHGAVQVGGHIAAGTPEGAGGHAHGRTVGHGSAQAGAGHGPATGHRASAAAQSGDAGGSSDSSHGGQAKRREGGWMVGTDGRTGGKELLVD